MHTMNEDSEYCLRWHRHLSNFIESFGDLLNDETLADVYFFAEGKLIKAHKVVLSSCSPYFQSLFKETIERHPIIVIKDAKIDHIKALLQFMYKGTVNVSQDSLEPIMKIAQSLNIKGLSDRIVNVEKKKELEDDNVRPISIHENNRIPSHSKISSGKYDSATHLVNENKNSVHPLSNIYPSPPTSVNPVLSSALNMPSALSHLTLPQLASLPPNLASSLASTLSNVIPHSLASFMPPREMPIKEESPNPKRRRKNGKSEVVESGDSDGRSSGSPGEGSNIGLPKIPATITPIGLHRQHVQNYLNNSHSQQQPRDLSMHSSNSHSTPYSNHNRSVMESPQRGEPPHDQKPHHANIPNLLLHHSTVEPQAIQDEPENLEHRPSQSHHEENGSELNSNEIDHRRSRSSSESDKTSPIASGERSEGGSSSHRQSPKFASDPESVVSSAKRSFSHETSSDNPSDEDGSDCKPSNSENKTDRSSDYATGSSSIPLQNDEMPQTPAFLGWPYKNEANSVDDSFSNFTPETGHDYFRALNLVRAGISGILPPRMPTDVYPRSSVPLGLPLFMKRDNESSDPKNYPFPEVPKQFTCDKCGRGYASTGNLKRHKKYECGVEPQFSCPICKKKFQHRHSVKIHVFSTHRSEAGDGGAEGMPNSSMMDSLPTVSSNASLASTTSALGIGVGTSASALMGTDVSSLGIGTGVSTIGSGVSGLRLGQWHLAPEASTTAHKNQES